MLLLYMQPDGSDFQIMEQLDHCSSYCFHSVSFIYVTFDFTLLSYSERN